MFSQEAWQHAWEEGIKAQECAKKGLKKSQELHLAQMRAWIDYAASAYAQGRT